MAVQTCEILAENLDAFRPYLLAEVVEKVESGRCHAFGVCTEDARSCGAISFVVHPSAIEVNSLYVDPAMRRQYCATQLLATVKYIAANLSVDRLFAYYSFPDMAEQQVLETFLAANGFDAPEIFARRYRISAQEIAKSAYFSKIDTQAPPLGCLVPFSQLSDELLQAIGQSPEIPEDLKPGRYLDRLDPQVSHAYVQDGICEGYVLFMNDCGVYRLAAAYSAQSSRGIFLRLIRASYAVFSHTAPAQFLELSAINERTRRLTEDLLRGADYQVYHDYRSDCTDVIAEINFLLQETL